MNIRCTIFCAFLFVPVSGFADESKCFGTTSNGRLEGGVRLPGKGPNFGSQGLIAQFLRRNFVHSTVRDTVVEAYAALARKHPGWVFKYAESGFAEGGEFPPHSTHQNGLSVDFLMPVTDADGAPATLPTHLLNKHGYAVVFDEQGRSGEYQIDFDMLAAHLVELHQAAKNQQVGLWRVVLAPKWKASLLKSVHGAYLRRNILIPNRRIWIEHDAHYHIDFQIPCGKMSPLNRVTEKSLKG